MTLRRRTFYRPAPLKTLSPNDVSSVFCPVRNGYTILGAEEVVAKFGVKPAALPDLFGLVGDVADNIPGEEPLALLSCEHHPRQRLSLLRPFVLSCHRRC